MSRLLVAIGLLCIVAGSGMAGQTAQSGEEWCLDLSRQLHGGAVAPGDAAYCRSLGLAAERYNREHGISGESATPAKNGAPTLQNASEQFAEVCPEFGEMLSQTGQMDHTVIEQLTAATTAPNNASLILSPRYSRNLCSIVRREWNFIRQYASEANISAEAAARIVLH